MEFSEKSWQSEYQSITFDFVYAHNAFIGSA